MVCSADGIPTTVEKGVGVPVAVSEGVVAAEVLETLPLTLKLLNLKFPVPDAL